MHTVEGYNLMDGWKEKLHQMDKQTKDEKFWVAAIVALIGIVGVSAASAYATKLIVAAAYLGDIRVAEVHTHYAQEAAAACQKSQARILSEKESK